MTETISLDVQGDVPRPLLHRIYQEITPGYVRDLFAQNSMPAGYGTIEGVVASYADGFPTQDLALKVIDIKGRIKFWGVASGCASRPERVAVKYLILDHIQSELAKAGVRSELNIAGLNHETIRYMNQRGMFKGKLPELKRVAKRKGNLEDIMIEVRAAMHAPV